MAQTSDPYASIATPIPASSTSVSSDPYESIATPAPGTTGVLGAINKFGEVTGDLATGFVKGAGDTVSGVSHLINKIPGVGETLAPEQGVKALDQMDDTNGNTTQQIGKGVEGIAEFAAGDAALDGVAKASKLVSLAQKYPLIAKTLTLATEHPWLAKIITEGTKGAIVGGGEGAVKGAQQGETVKGGVEGAAVGGATGAMAGAIIGGAQAVKNARVNPFRAILEGKGVAQDAAQDAVRGGVTSGVPASAPNVAAGVQTAPLLEGNKTILDEPLKVLENNKRGLYQAIDKEVGFNYEDLQQGLKNDKRAFAQLGNTPEDVTAKAKLLNSINDSTQRLADADTALKAKGIDPKAANAANTAWKAGQDFKTVLTRNTNPDGSVNVDTLLRQSKMLRFSKRGDRLAQFMQSPAAADTYMKELEDAQKAGVHAMKIQKIAKWVGGLAATGLGIGAGAELGSHAVSLLSPAP